MHLTSLFVLLLVIAAAYANTEKAIFLAPPPTTIPDVSPGFEDLNLISLSPGQLSRRLSLPAAFPSAEQPRGLDSWYLLSGLYTGQSYEVRICWAAVQPTAYSLDIHNITHVFDTPSLITSLADFSEGQLRQSPAQIRTRSPSEQGSVLFLRVQSAADFFTTNKTLMQSPPPVDVDIILDPYLASVFPQSLLPTAVYIVALAIGSWLLSSAIWKRLFSGHKPHSD